MNHHCENQNTSFLKNRHHRPRSSHGFDWVSITQGRQGVDPFQTQSWTGFTALCSYPREIPATSRDLHACLQSQHNLQRSSWQQDLIDPYNVI